jgi:hypothetical protein
MRKLTIVLSLLLSLGLFYACSSDEEDTSEESISESCISGTIVYEHDDFVFVSGLKMPENDIYSYINTVVVSKDEFPFENYQIGDVIDFEIVDVNYAFPPFKDTLHSYPPSTDYLCSIKPCR